VLDCAIIYEYIPLNIEHNGDVSPENGLGVKVNKTSLIKSY